MDDLTTIKGIGKAAADKLAAAGITTFEQLAHNAVAGQNGVKAEWIAAAAARLSNERPEDRPDASGAPGTGSPSASADPFGDAPAGTNSADREMLERAIENIGGDVAALFPNTPQSEKGDGGAPELGASVVPPGHAAWLELEELGEDEARRRYPLVIEAVQRWAELAGSMGSIKAGPTVRISAKRDGFRRCGLAHPKAATDHAVEHFTPNELERLLAEPLLTVELV
ncbi:HI1506-related protein [Mesorhizobium sp. DCY119]|uniref:HI1506-related protein n=1 Tax=Mesorhizobium sp. DCY119 TaxID=2108445 RepID=UPI0018D50F29|nr:HI1506-related protein [Mesorhizobium sp. DCY119]